jgi:hypothetical protein
MQLISPNRQFERILNFPLISQAMDPRNICRNVFDMLYQSFSHGL